MPSRFAASMIVLPSGTSSFWPSISKSRGMASDVIRHETLLVLDVVFEFRAVVFDERAHRHRGRISERTDRATLNVVGDLIEQIEVLQPAFPVLDAVDHAVEPSGALATRRAL